uniref:C40 family peptidase n=1 Tax=Ilumatobacter nonamiensis TaxID=467093 RepID=UPI00058E15B0
MKHFLRVAPVAFIIALVVPAMNPHVAAASPVDQQRNKVESIVDELERLEEQARVIGEEYGIAIDRQAELGEEITELEDQIGVKEGELTELRAELGDMAVRSFVGSGTTPLGPLFEDSGDINDVLQRDQLARVALSAGDVSTDELDALVSDLEEDRVALDDKIAEAEELADSLTSAQEDTEAKTAEYQQARIDAEAELGELIAEEEARRAAESAARVQAEIEAAQAEAAAQAQASSNSGGGGGGNSNSNSNSGSSSNSNSGGGGSSSGSSSSNSSSSSGGGGGSSTPAPSTPSAPPPSSRAGTAVSAAMSQQGVPYRYATSNPGVSFDCSGLTAYAWAQAGVYLPHQSAQQYASIPHVSQGAAQPGDLIFYYSPISHVG